MKVTLEGHIIVPDEDLESVKSALANHIVLTRNEPGCLMFEVNVDESDPCRFNVYEEFTDRSAFEAHQQRVKTSDWGKLTRDVSRHYSVLEET
jgi:quinol monooxygenase YgiN